MKLACRQLVKHHTSIFELLASAEQPLLAQWNTVLSRISCLMISMGSLASTSMTMLVASILTKNNPHQYSQSGLPRHGGHRRTILGWGLITKYQPLGNRACSTSECCPATIYVLRLIRLRQLNITDGRLLICSDDSAGHAQDPLCRPARCWWRHARRSMDQETLDSGRVKPRIDQSHRYVNFHCYSGHS